MRKFTDISYSEIALAENKKLQKEIKELKEYNTQLIKENERLEFENNELEKYNRTLEKYYTLHGKTDLEYNKEVKQLKEIIKKLLD